MILNIIIQIMLTVLRVYDLVLLAKVIVQVLHVTPNQWTVLLDRVTEPVLAPVRGFLHARIPAKFIVFDWTPLAVWIASGLVQRLLALLHG